MADETVSHRLGTHAVLRIVEVFGPTIQGEGPAVGRAAYLLRLAGCNLTCDWCDTAFSWDPDREDPERPPRDITAAAVLALLDPRTNDSSAPPPSVRRLVVTGGEPLLQAAQLVDVLSSLVALGWVVEVETSGSVSPGPLAVLVDQFNVSPKLAHSGVSERARLRLRVLDEFARLPSASFKFVVEESADLDEVAQLLGQLCVPVSPDRVFVMAQGTDPGLLLKRSKDLADAVTSRGWGLTPRWHALLWADERGR
ncbi:7-carboxy-7-deazaguanine synthase QueE [Mycobacterium sp. Aquia_213]|uniref:7-carboxy-7-deazaguanine synthase QueE n=1 Tax=Mycobacterium sp. Aquia_213 TaxID=2991728 RepID=UPI002271C0A5|nr:7-carboxy-7-deazaguanine synthase QueE [Mycobacterium sp. Aquia_213]WAC92232.1 7-carboxy-7-deazaguanine synthase QueE [Mycobacterium sp. Aquia_213]